LYTAINNTGILEIVIELDQDLFSYLEKPLEVDRFEVENLHISQSMRTHTTSNKPNDENQIQINHLNSEEKLALSKLLKMFPNLLDSEGKPLSFTNVVKHKIQTTDSIPIYTKAYQYPFAHKKEVRMQITKMLDEKIVKNSHSPCSSLVWVVPKKSIMTETRNGD